MNYIYKLNNERIFMSCFLLCVLMLCANNSESSFVKMSHIGAQEECVKYYKKLSKLNFTSSSKTIISADYLSSQGGTKTKFFLNNLLTSIEYEFLGEQGKAKYNLYKIPNSDDKFVVNYVEEMYTSSLSGEVVDDPKETIVCNFLEYKFGSFESKINSNAKSFIIEFQGYSGTGTLE